MNYYCIIDKNNTVILTYNHNTDVFEGPVKELTNKYGMRVIDIDENFAKCINVPIVQYNHVFKYLVGEGYHISKASLWKHIKWAYKNLYKHPPVIMMFIAVMFLGYIDSSSVNFFEWLSRLIPYTIGMYIVLAPICGFMNYDRQETT